MFPDIRSSITTVFPKHILCLDDVCTEHTQEFAAACKLLVRQSGYKNNDLLNVHSTHMTKSDLHEYTVFQPLVKVIKNSMVEYASYVGYDMPSILKFNLTNMWVNINNQGGYNFPHTHPGCVVSGVYYVQTPARNKIVFFDNYKMIDTAINAQGEGHEVKHFDCKTGRLLMFKSDLLHANPPQPEPGEKIAISFNFIR